MRTETRAKILKIIQEKGPIRPAELVQILHVSPQALHRHLRTLTHQGLIETRGSAPTTQYALAGMLDINRMAQWVLAPVLTQSPAEDVCDTQDVFAARLNRVKSGSPGSIPEAILPLVITTAAEIGNNSFDHNLGQWRDVPGCWFETRQSGDRLWIWIADRGQGVYHSLAKVHPHITDDQTALRAAFETVISGRAPEQRGNGLKFVRGAIENKPGCGLGCVSGNARVQYGEEGPTCQSLLNRHVTRVDGIVTLLVWRIT